MIKNLPGQIFDYDIIYMQKKIIIFPIILSLFITALLCHLNYKSYYKSLIHDFTNESGNSFRSKIYLPFNQNKHIPTIIVIPGLNTSKGLHHIVAVELVKRGLCVIVIDISGNGERIKGQPVYEDEESDLMAIFDGNLPFVDYEKVFFVGHSYGSGIAVNFALKHPEKILGVAGIGFYYLSDEVPNFLAGSGLYDEALPPYYILDSFNKISDIELEFDKTYGNFHDKSAKKLIYSPTANHATELKDDFIIKDIIIWIENILYGKIRSPIKLTEKKNRYSIAFMGWILFLLSLAGVYAFRINTGKKFYLYWRVSLILLLFIIFFRAPLKGLITPLFISTFVILSFFFVLIAGNLSRIKIREKYLTPKFQLEFWGTFIGTLFIMICVLCVLRLRLAVKYYDFSVKLIYYIPKFAISVLLIVPTFLMPDIRRFLITDYSVSPSFHPILIILWILEIVFPGWFTFIISYLTERIRNVKKLEN